MQFSNIQMSFYYCCHKCFYYFNAFFPTVTPSGKQLNLKLQLQFAVNSQSLKNPTKSLKKLFMARWRLRNTISDFDFISVFFMTKGFQIPISL